MTYKIQIIFIIFAFILLQSCKSSRNFFYTPEEHNMLQLTHKNDIKLSASSSIFTLNDSDNSKSKHVNAQVAYSPIKHLGLFGNYLFREKKNFNPSLDNGSKYNLSSVAIGTYYLTKPMNSGQHYDANSRYPYGLLTDFYLGIGRGKVTNTFNSVSGCTLEFNKPYAQIGFHWLDKKADVSIVYRFGRVYYSGGNIYGINDDALAYFNYMQANNNQNFTETSCKVSFGKIPFRGYVSVIRSQINSGLFFDNLNIATFFDENFRGEYFVINLGIVLDINEIHWSLKNSKK